MVACVRNQYKTMHMPHSIENTRKQKQHTHIATNAGVSAKTIKKTMHIASQTQNTETKNTHIAANGGLPAKTVKKTIHIVSKTQKNRGSARECLARSLDIVLHWGVAGRVGGA